MIPPNKQTEPWPSDGEEQPKPIAPYDPSDKVGDPRDFAFGGEVLTRTEVEALAAKLDRIDSENGDILDAAKDAVTVLYELAGMMGESQPLEPKS